MSEAKLERRVRKLMKPLWVDHKHRDFAAGVPDISFQLKYRPIMGWIEFKFARVPANHDTVVYIRWKPEQRLWVRRWGEAGCPCYLVLGYADNIMLFWWQTALDCFSMVTGSTLFSKADYVWEFKDFTAQKFADALVDLSRGHNEYGHYKVRRYDNRPSS